MIFDALIWDLYHLRAYAIKGDMGFISTKLHLEWATIIVLEKIVGFLLKINQKVEG